MTIDLDKLSSEAQKEMLEELRWDDLKGLLRCAGLPAQKDKKAAAAALVDSEKLTCACTFRVGLRAVGESGRIPVPKPNVREFRNRQEWYENIETVESTPELEAVIRDLVTRQESSEVCDVIKQPEAEPHTVSKRRSSDNKEGVVAIPALTRRIPISTNPV